MFQEKKESAAWFELIGNRAKDLNQKFDKATQALRAGDLDAAHVGYQEVSSHQSELLNALPATREFLEMKGLDHFDQLDKADREEYRKFLELKLEEEKAKSA